MTARNDWLNGKAFIEATIEAAQQPDSIAMDREAYTLWLLTGILGFAVEQPKAAEQAIRLLEEFAASTTGETREQVEATTRAHLRDSVFDDDPVH